MIEVDVTANCEVCEEKLDVDYGAVITCCACYDRRFDHADIHDAITYSAQHDYHWKDKEGYSDFESEESLTMFMRGVKHGYASALFWLCDHLGMVEFFEDEIGHNFENVKGAKSHEK